MFINDSLNWLKVIFLCLCCFHGQASYLQADKLHLITVCDNLDPLLGASVLSDSLHIERQFKAIAHVTKLQMQVHFLKDKAAEPKKVMKLIKEIQPEARDVVVFYFSGHGYHLESKSKDRWPNFYFSQVHKGLSMENVVRALKKKKVRLSIVLGDCCNNFIEDRLAPEVLLVRAGGMPMDTEQQKKIYKKLFCHTSGQILATAATKGNYASGNKLGGFFTHYFLHSLNQPMIDYEQVSWEDILRHTQEFLLLLYGQEADFELNLKEKS